MKNNYLRRQYLFDPHSPKPYKLSRTKVELFLECPRCFYLDRRLGLRRPGRVAYHLNNAVDLLLKKEFDHYRASGTPHPLMRQEGVEAVPYFHDQLDRWREPLHGGLQFIDPGTNLLLTGAPDDLWVDSAGALHVVDYKATRVLSQDSLSEGEHPGYERQLEFYSWLLEKMGFTVSPETYFVVAETKLNRTALDHRLDFDLHLLRHQASWAWVEPLLEDLKATLLKAEAPSGAEDCEYCRYIESHEGLKVRPVQTSLL